MNRLAGPWSAVAVAVRGRGRSVGGLSIGYHDVRRAEPVDPWDVTMAQLDSHLGVLEDAGFTFVTLAGLIDAVRSGTGVDGLVAVTFDEALCGVLDVVDLFERRGAPMTVLSTTVGIGEPPEWWQGARRTLDGAELRSLHALDLVEIGAHTRTHRSLVSLGPDEVGHELRDCRVELERIVDAPVTSLAYPHGHHDQAVRDAAAASGYRGAVTFTNGRIRPGDDPFALARLTAGGHLGSRRLRYHLRRSADSWPG